MYYVKREREREALGARTSPMLARWIGNLNDLRRRPPTSFFETGGKFCAMNIVVFLKLREIEEEIDNIDKICFWYFDRHFDWDIGIKRLAKLRDKKSN